MTLWYGPGFFLPDADHFTAENNYVEAFCMSGILPEMLAKK